MIIKIIWIIILINFTLTVFLGGIGFQERHHPVNIPQPLQIHAITVPENCYEQLKNANMIHIKILEANEK